MRVTNVTLGYAIDQDPLLLRSVKSVRHRNTVVSSPVATRPK
jgi:hypothetical protein